MRTIVAQAAWLPGPDGRGQVRPATVTVADDGQILEVRPPHAGDGPALDGLVLPGLVDAHAHLELDLAAPGPAGQGFVAWAAGHLAHGPPADPGPVAARQVAAFGTAWLGDVSNRGHTAPWLEAAGLAGAVHHEHLGFDRGALPSRLAAVRPPVQRPSGVWELPAAHAVFSTAPSLLQATLGPGPGPRRAIHLAESEDEMAFLTDGTGPHAELLDRLGRDWRWFDPPGTSGVGWLDRLGLLGPHLLTVHGVHLTAEDRARLAATGTAVALCPRSNLHIGGRLPDVPALLAARIPLALGTDSRASSPDHDVLAEAAQIAAAWPELDPGLWLDLATGLGARAVGAPGHGQLRPGTRPGVLHVALARPADLRAGTPARSWLVPPASTP